MPDFAKAILTYASIDKFGERSWVRGGLIDPNYAVNVQ